MGNQYAGIAAINSIDKQSDKVDAGNGMAHVIKLAAARTGVDFSYMMKKAAQESSFDPNAVATSSSATGLYQFTSQTWLHMVKDYGADYGLGSYAAQITKDSAGRYSVSDPAARKEILALRKDASLSAVMSGELDRENAAYLQKKVGGKIGATELYLAHFLGAYGASNLIREMRNNPDAAAADMLPSAAAANSSVFYDKTGEARSVKQVYQMFARKFDGGSAATQVASANPVSTARASAATVTASAAMGVGSDLYAAKTMQVASLAASGTNMPLSGDSTLIAAMVFGQMAGVGTDNASDAYAKTDEQRKKSAISVLSAVV